MKITTRKVGNWDAVRKMLETVGPEVIKKGQDRIRRIAEELLANIRKNIEQQNLRLTPLSKPYLRRKLTEGLDSRILIATHEYIDKLRIQESGRGIEFKVFIGAFDSDMHHNSGMSMGELARYLEEGTTRMPARPHISRTWNRMRRDIAKEITASVAKAIDDSKRR